VCKYVRRHEYIYLLMQMYQVYNLSANKLSSSRYKMLEKEDSLVLSDEYASSAVAGFNKRVVSRWPIFLLNETVSTCWL